MNRNTIAKSFILWALPCLLIASSYTHAADQPTWGQKFTRNMISSETNLPETFDPATGKNVKWTVPLGKQTWATPIVASGRVFIGTNNETPRDPRHRGDRGVFFCLDEKDGSLQWQLVVPKMENDIYLDWPKAGMCSPPAIEGDKVYMVTNRYEVVCLDIHGLANGNDGPYKDEARHHTPTGADTIPLGKLDADIIWLHDMPAISNVYPHDSAHCSIMIIGRYLYLNSSNGVDNTHRNMRSPKAPSLIVIDKETGKLIARDNEMIGPDIFHSTWSSPARAIVNDRDLIFFCGGNGICYAFDAIDQSAHPTKPLIFNRVWRFDPDPTSPKVDIHKYRNNPEVSPSNIKSMPVYHDGKIYITVGGDIWWGKKKSWLKCFDAAGKGEVTDTALIWSCDLGKHCCSTPAIYNGLVFVADLDGIVHCVDVKTGKPYWTHKTRGEYYASPMIADGKVYIGDRRSNFQIFAADKQKKLLANIDLDSPIAATATCANNTIYIATMRTLYAIAK